MQPVIVSGQMGVSAAVIRAEQAVAVASAGMILSVPKAITLLTLLLALKFITCIFNERRNLRESTKQSALILILSLGAYIGFYIAHDQMGLSLGFDPAVMITMFFCTQTLIAITVNAASIGLPIPPAILEALIKANGTPTSDKRELEALRLKQGQEVIALNLKQSQDGESK